MLSRKTPAGPSLLNFPRITDKRGALTFLEGEGHIPFAIKRIYYLYEVPKDQSRGGHAHKNLEQVMIAISGSFDVILDDGQSRERITLNRCDQGLYIPRMMWRDLENFTPGAVCLVIASEHYDEADYYRDYNDFLRDNEVRSSEGIFS